MAPENSECPRCGNSFPRSQVEGEFSGICPKCLAGLMTTDPGETEASFRTENAKIPIETIRPPLKPGASFKGFEVLEVLGQGGMGVVYKARQQSLNRLVALKLLNSQLATSEEFVARFEREAKVIASLNHPNVVHVHDFGKDDGLLYLVMEHVDGPTLEDVMKQKKQEPAAFLKAIRDVAKGLERVHQAGLVHRDVKPSNILMAKDGTAKISDFGLAIETEGSQKLTQSGMFVGTPHYVSPEHAQGKKVDGRSDLYSLGVILFEGYAGRPPFQAPSATALLLKHVNEAPPALYKLAPQSPRAVQEIVRKLLAKNPAARHDTAASLVRDLDRAIEEGKAPKVPGTARKTPTPAPAPEASKLPIKWIGAGVAAAAVIAILVAVFSGKSEPPKNEERPAPVAVTRPALPEPRKEPMPEPAPAPAPAPVAPPPAQDPVPVPPPPAPRTPSAVEEAFREGEKLFEQARAAFEEGKARSSVETLTDAAFKADAAKAKYAAVQEIGTDELKAKAVEQVKLVQQFQKLVNESRLAIMEAKGVKPAPTPVPAASPEGKPAPAAVAPVPGVPPPALAPAARRAAVPNATAQKDSEKQVRALFKEEYAKKAPADVQSLARKLLDLGATVSNDEGARFVMLRDARDLAAQAGDLETAMKAVDLLAQSFEIEPVSSKVAVVNKAAPLMRGADGMLSLSKAYLSIMEEGVASGQYDPAATVASKAEGSAKASNDLILLSRVQSVSKDLAFLQRESSSVRSAVKTLEQKPDDPAANLSAGRFACLGAGDWAKGLPMLAKGSDALLKAAAEKELAGNDDAAAGDAWWAAAEKERTAEYKKRMQSRAARWYLSALPGAAGLAKLQMESRLKQIGGLLLPASIATQRTEIVGGPGGASYDDHSREGGVLVGLRMNWVDQGLQVLKSVQPLFSSGSSLQEGPVRGKAMGPFKENVAKPGYAVGGLIARGSNRVNGLKIVYMKIAGLGLDPRDSYESEWFGDRGAGDVRLGGDGTYVLGICGGAFEDVDSLGLVLLRREIGAAPPAPVAAPAAKGVRGVNLLGLVDISKDSVVGAWKQTSKGLSSPQVKNSLLQIPYAPPEEYDLELMVELKEGSDGFGIGLAQGNSQVLMVIGSWGQQFSGLRILGGQYENENETSTRGAVFQAGRPTKVVCSVRRERIDVTADGKKLVSWKSDYNQVTLDVWKPTQKDTLYLAAMHNVYEVSRMVLTPVGGQGHALREPAPAPAAKGTVDLLRAIDPKLDFVAGDFTLDGSGLLMPPGVLRARVMVPYTPPAEYDFTMVLERKEGVNSLNYGVLWGGKLISLVVDGKGPAIEDAAGMDFINGRPFFDNETTVKGPFLLQGKPSTIVTSVRKGSLTMTIDGRVIFSWKGDPSRLAENPAISVPNKGAMSVGSYDASFLISQMTVTPVSGQGTFLRKPPAAPATAAPKNSIDLLALIDPQKDSVKGDWTTDGTGLLCQAGDHIRLQIPYSPPDEYDLLMTVDRREGSDGLLVGLVKGASQWSVTMDTQSSGSFKSGFESLDNQGPSGNATTYSGPVFTNGVETTLEFRVRKAGVTVLAGGKPIIDWRGSFNRLSLPDGWKVKSPNALFLAAWGSRYHFSRIVLVPVSGTGKKLR